ncbi:40231_t:CDS:2, partial [Gigaspora margarita]
NTKTQIAKSQNVSLCVPMVRRKICHWDLHRLPVFMKQKAGI